MATGGRETREDEKADDFSVTIRRAVEAAVVTDGLPRDRVLGLLAVEMQRNALLLLSSPDNGEESTR